MTLTLKTNHNVSYFLCTLVTLFFLSSQVQAQETVSLSVTPTLYEMTASREQEWSSVLRVINANPVPLTVYLEVVNFAPEGEGGQGKFLPLLNEVAADNTLASWVKFNETEITIPAEKTVTLPFTITVPADAPPGGHFGAIMVGTKQPETQKGPAQVQTSQVVTSLIFLRLTGDITESGSIRSFRTLESVYEEPEVSFQLRFQNTGNVHLQPQGEIKIYNMWGKERGRIPVNQKTHFGNVLPESIRDYRFTWEGEWSISDIGRYRAVTTLAYGIDSRKFASSETAFWILPLKLLFIILGTVVGIILLFTWAVKLYIRRMLSLAGVDPELRYAPVPRRAVSITKGRRKPSIVAPLNVGMLDLRQRLGSTDSFMSRLVVLRDFVFAYKKFFLLSTAILLAIVLITWFIASALTPQRSYEITLDSAEAGVTISSEQLVYDTLRENNPLPSERQLANFPPMQIINRSGEEGLAARLRVKLENAGYVVGQLSSDYNVAEKRTVVVFPPEYTDGAKLLSKQMEGALLSSFADAVEAEYPVTIYVGSDLKDALQ